MRRIFPVAVTLLAILVSGSAWAARYPAAYRWQTITTDHFHIHYHQGEEELARRAASIAERVHERIVPFFGYEPKERTHLVLSDHVDVSNGSASTIPRNRMEVYISAPGADPSTPLEHYDDWLNLVITHEYAHILHLDQASGFWGATRQVFGRTPLAFPNQFSPLWMIEGIATVVESEATDAGRLKGSFLEMILRTAAIEEEFPTEPQASGLSPEWPGGSARYYFGSSFLAWLGREHGAEALGEYFRDYSGNIVPYRINASARTVFGRSIRDLWNDWTAETMNRYRSELEALRSEGLTERALLTELGNETRYPMISPDGERLAYAHRGIRDWPSLRILDTRSGREIRRIRVNSTSPLSWSPDGARIAFSQLEYAGSFSILSDLYLWNTETGDVRRLTTGSRLKSPAFTPDGRSLIAVQTVDGKNRLVSVDVSSGAIQPIVEPADYRQFSEPNVSPDGSRFAVAEWLDGRIDIVVYDMRGNRQDNLTRDLPRGTHASPRFSSDGETIWFSSDTTGISNLYSVPSSGGDIERWSNVYGGAFFPTTSDGRTIYYADYSARGFDIARIDAARSLPVQSREPRSVLGTHLSRDLQVPPALEDAEPSPYSPARTILPRWWIPIIGGSGGGEGEESEITIGGYTSGQDVLGFHRYDLQLAVTSGREDGTKTDYSAAYSYDRFYPTLTVAGAEFSDDTTVTIDFGSESRLYRERIQRTIVQATFPVNRFRWQLSATAGALRESVGPDSGFDLSQDQLASVGLFDGTLNGARASLFLNTAREFGASISPENGITARIDHQWLSGERSLQQSRADLRGFLSIPWSESRLGNHVVAARAAAGMTSGDFLLERELKVGGAGDQILIGVDTTNLPVRGAPAGLLRGQNAALLSLEYRLPLFRIDRGPATWPLFFQRISGGVFADAGTAWNDEAIELPALSRPATRAFDNDTTVVTAGAELSFDIFLGFYIPLRYRVGAAWIVKSPACSSDGCERERGARFYAGLGRSF